MKLPTNKKERIQIFVLIGIVAVAVTYFGYQMGIRPLFEKKSLYKKNIEELKEKTRIAENKARLIRNDLSDNRKALETILSETDRYVLLATIGENYQLGVEEMMQKYARAAGVIIDPVREVGILDIPHNNARAGRNVLRAYTARVTFRGGYDDLIRLLKEVETSSPYVCVSSISIAPQAEPEVHNIAIDIQWPVWAEKGTAETLKKQAVENAEAEAKP